VRAAGNKRIGSKRRTGSLERAVGRRSASKNGRREAALLLPLLLRK